MLILDFQPRFWVGFAPVFCLYTGKALIFVTFMFPAQLYRGYWWDFEILLPSFHFSIFMEAPKLFLCWTLNFYLHGITSEEGIIWAGGNVELSCSVWYMKRIRKHKTDRLRNLLILPRSPSPQETQNSGICQKKKKSFFLTQVCKNQRVWATLVAQPTPAKNQIN